MKILEIITESHNKCPHCGGPIVSESELMEKKDACYYKIKSSAKVWPSAYASGRLVQCRKKGAANYGNKSEGLAEEQLNEFAPLLAAGARLFMAAAPKIAQVVGKAGQAGARGAGQAAKAGTEIAAKNAGQIGIGAGAYEIGSSVADIAKDITAKVGTALDEKTLLDLAALAFKYAIPAGIVLAILYGGKKAIDSLFADPKTQQGVEEGENWSKHNNKRAGGMSKKSVASYRRSHPGSKIQTAVTTKPSKLKKGSKSAKRRASFCARMRGMKKHRTGAKTARDPNSNINKSLRRWHCESIEELHELVMLAEQFIRNNKK